MKAADIIYIMEGCKIHKECSKLPYSKWCKECKKRGLKYKEFILHFDKLDRLSIPWYRNEFMRKAIELNIGMRKDNQKED